jgi:hypothetical protein
MTETNKERSALEMVGEIAERQIEEIRLRLCPEESDVYLVDDGTLDTVVALDCDLEFRYDQEHASHYRDEETGELDLEEFVSDHWDEIRDEAYERFHEHGLSFDYCDPDDYPHHFCYLISTGGPGTEIRFFCNPDGRTLYKAEFWYLPWFDGAWKNVTKDPTVQTLWEFYVDTGTIDYLLEKSRNER